MTAADPEGRVRHLLDVMHKTYDDAGDPIAAGMVPSADGLGQVEYLDSTGWGGGGLPWFNVMDPVYGAVNNNSTNDRTAVNLAIAALNAAGGGVLYFPAGAGYLISGGALTTITVQCLVLGDGGGRTQPNSALYQSSGTNDLFTFSSEGVEVRGLYMENTVGGFASTSRAIVSSAAGWMFITDCGVILFNIGIDLESSVYYHIKGCYISNKTAGIKIRNTALPDSGDGSIIDNIIVPNASGAGVLLNSAGGLRVIGNKINANAAASTIGIDISIGSFATGALQIVGNSIEQCLSYGVRLAASGTGTWTGWVIADNQFGLYDNTAGNCIKVDSNTSDGIFDGVIEGNVFRTNSNSNPAVAMTKAKNVRLSGNVVNGWGSLFSATSCTGIIDDSGAIAASVLITGTPSSGDVPIASSGTAAAWGAPSSGPSFATPSIVLSTAAAGGAASTVIRSDSTIAAFDATVPVTQAFGDSAATGSVAFAARRDHKHGMPATSNSFGPILIADTHSTPLVFGDLIQTDAQDDLLYADP